MRDTTPNTSNTPMESKVPTPKRNQAIRKVGSTFVVVQNKETPRDDEWDEFLKLLNDHRAELPKLKLLVMTSGGGPSAAQRKRLEQTLAGSPMLVAVVSDNMKVRFVASTIALFHRDYSSFTESEIDEAYNHLHLTFSEQRQVEDAIKDMNRLIQ